MHVGNSSQLITLPLLLLPPHAFPLLQHGAHPTGYSPSETSPVLILPTSTVLWEQTAPGWALLTFCQ